MKHSCPADDLYQRKTKFKESNFFFSILFLTSLDLVSKQTKLRNDFKSGSCQIISISDSSVTQDNFEKYSSSFLYNI
jgi:hypothetical protein